MLHESKERGVPQSGVRSWVLLGVDCSWDGRKRSIRPSMQTEPHGIGCTSLKNNKSEPFLRAEVPMFLVYVTSAEGPADTGESAFVTCKRI